jgi:hypothetical protein
MGREFQEQLNSEKQQLKKEKTRRDQSKGSSDEEIFKGEGDAHGGFTCTCNLCFEQSKPLMDFDLLNKRQDVREYLYKDGVPRKFTWFIDKLLPCNPKIRGCEIVFPDTAIFHKGRPV